MPVDRPEISLNARVLELIENASSIAQQLLQLKQQLDSLPDLEQTEQMRSVITLILMEFFAVITYSIAQHINGEQPGAKTTQVAIDIQEVDSNYSTSVRETVGLMMTKLSPTQAAELIDMYLSIILPKVLLNKSLFQDGSTRETYIDLCRKACADLWGPGVSKEILNVARWQISAESDFLYGGRELLLASFDLKWISEVFHEAVAKGLTVPPILVGKMATDHQSFVLEILALCEEYPKRKDFELFLRDQWSKNVPKDTTGNPRKVHNLYLFLYQKFNEHRARFADDYLRQVVPAALNEFMEGDSLTNVGQGVIGLLGYALGKHVAELQTEYLEKERQFVCSVSLQDLLQLQPDAFSNLLKLMVRFPAIADEELSIILQSQCKMLLHEIETEYRAKWAEKDKELDYAKANDAAEDYQERVREERAQALAMAKKASALIKGEAATFSDRLTYVLKAGFTQELFERLTQTLNN